MIPYQFAILRYRHSASAGELVNIGLVMWVPSEGRILHSLNDRYSRLTSFFAGFDGTKYRKMVRRLNRHFSDMSSGEAQLKLFSKSSDGLNDLLERLIHRDDSSFQWSEIMAGISEKPDERLTELFVEFVTKHEQRQTRDRRGEDDIWQNVDAKLREKGLDIKLEKDVQIQGKDYSYKFKSGWTNGTRQVLEPISFDYLYQDAIVEKATTWSGRLFSLRNASDFGMIGIVSKPRASELFNAYDRAMRILGDAPRVRRLITEDQVAEAIRVIENDLADHK